MNATRTSTSTAITDADYAAMMIAAGWIGAGDLDDEYQEYLRKKSCDYDEMSYSQWQATKADWAELNAQYEREIEPLYMTLEPGFDLTHEQKKLQKRLLDNMMYIEVALGY